MANITATEIARFVKSAKTGDKGTEIVTGTGDLKNVSLRRSGGTVAWLFRYRGMQTAFGYSHPVGGLMLDNVSEAAKVVPMLRREFDAGGKEAVCEFINGYHDCKKDGKALEFDHIKKTLVKPDVPTTWTLRECIEQMLKDRSRDTHSVPLSRPSADDYRLTMKRPECQVLMDTCAAQLKRGDVEKVRDVLRNTKGLDPARKLVTHVRAAMEYSFYEHLGQSGLDGVEHWWLMLKFKEKSKARERAPTLTDIAKVMLLAEHFSRHPAPKAKIERPSIGLEVLHAFNFVCLTAQRQGATVQLKCADIHEINGVRILEWTGVSMKGKKKFALPVPSPVDNFVPPLKNIDGRELVFESYLDQTTPVSRSAIHGVLKKLRNFGLLEKNGIKYFSPHDIRRTLVDVMDSANLAAGASAILDHVIEGEKNLKHQIAKVTSLSYFAVQRIPLKSEAMEIWTKTLIEEIDRQKREWVPVVA